MDWIRRLLLSIFRRLFAENLLHQIMQPSLALNIPADKTFIDEIREGGLKSPSSYSASAVPVNRFTSANPYLRYPAKT